MIVAHTLVHGTEVTTRSCSGLRSYVLHPTVGLFQPIGRLHIHCGYQLSTSHTHPFNGPLSGTTWVSQYQKSKTNLDFAEATDSEWQWHQLGHMQVCTSLQTDNHTSTQPLSFFTGRMPFLPRNQQRQSIEAFYITSMKNIYTLKQQSQHQKSICKYTAAHVNLQ